MYKLTTNVMEKTNIMGNTLSSSSYLANIRPLGQYSKDFGSTCINSSIKNIIDILKLVIISLMLVWLYKQFFCQENNENFTQQQKDDLKLKTLSEMISSNCKPEYCNMNSWGIKQSDIPENMSVSNFSTSKGCCLIPNDLKTFIYERRCGNS